MIDRTSASSTIACMSFSIPVALSSPVLTSHEKPTLESPNHCNMAESVAPLWDRHAMLPDGTRPPIVPDAKLPFKLSVPFMSPIEFGPMILIPDA